LKKIRDSNKGGRWWIKADACDLRQGLKESMRHEWSGDCDLGDGKLDALYKEYGLGLKNRKANLHDDLSKVISALDKDLKFLQDGEKEAYKSYSTKQKQLNASEDSLFALAWTYEGFKTLIGMNKDLKSTACNIQSRLLRNLIAGNVQKDVGHFRNSLLKYVQSLYSKKREAASHMMVLMVADEKRNFKPYALPVQFLPYHSVTDAKLRELFGDLRKCMVNLGMTVVGEFLKHI
jgi:ribosomal protein S17E